MDICTPMMNDMIKWPGKKRKIIAINLIIIPSSYLLGFFVWIYYALLIKTY